MIDRKNIERPTRRRLSAVGVGLLLLAAGCGSGLKDGETSPEIASAQESSRAAWAKAKADGTDKRVNTPTPNQQRGRGYVNRPGS